MSFFPVILCKRASFSSLVFGLTFLVCEITAVAQTIPSSPLLLSGTSPVDIAPKDLRWLPYGIPNSKFSSTTTAIRSFGLLQESPFGSWSDSFHWGTPTAGLQSLRFAVWSDKVGIGTPTAGLQDLPMGKWSDKHGWGSSTKNVFSDATKKKAIEIEYLRDKLKREAFNKQYQSLLIPKVKFSEASFDSALEYLRQQAEKVSGGSTKVNIVSLVPAGFGSKNVTLELNNVPFLDALRYVCDQANTDFTIQTYAIVITDNNHPLPKHSNGVLPVTQQRVSNLIIPKIEFNEAVLGDALETLKQQTGKLLEGYETINIVSRISSQAKTKPITLNLTGIPFLEALRYICDLADAKFTVQKHAIVISCADPPKMRQPKTNLKD